MPLDRTWLVIATYELRTGDNLKAAQCLFEVGAMDHGMEEWVLRNLQCPRAQYKQIVVDQTKQRPQGPGDHHSTKGPEIKDNRMEEDITPGVGDAR